MLKTEYTYAINASNMLLVRFLVCLMFWEPSSFVHVSIAIDSNIHTQQHKLVFPSETNATATTKEQIVWTTYEQQNVFSLVSMFELQMAHTLDNQESNDLREDKLNYLRHYNYNMVNETSRKDSITTTTLTTTNECLDASCKLINFQSNQLKLYDESIGNDTCDTMNINNENNPHINSTFHVLKGSLFLFSFFVFFCFFGISCFFFQDFKFNQAVSSVFISRLKHSFKLISRTCCCI